MYRWEGVCINVKNLEENKKGDLFVCVIYIGLKYFISHLKILWNVIEIKNSNVNQELFWLHYVSYHFQYPSCIIYTFSNFSCRFLDRNNFFQFELSLFYWYEIWETSRSKLKKHSVTRNCSDLSLFE